MKDLLELLRENPYPGRGIVTGIGRSAAHAFVAYFIMGRSENSRNRVFAEKDGGIVTEAADPAKLQDPSLVIYAPVRLCGPHTVITNGDQTDTIVSALEQQGRFGGVETEFAFEAALRTRTFEPDPPILTPRISAMLTAGFDGFTYKMSILKSAEGNAQSARRFFWEYAQPEKERGHYIHTYSGREVDGRLESFSGEPVCVDIPGDTAGFGQEIWQALNPDNKVSLHVRTLSADGTVHTEIFNKYSKI